MNKLIKIYWLNYSIMYFIKCNGLRLLMVSFWLIIGCHNNAHLRTQKILEPGEKVYSISGVLPAGGIDEDLDRSLTETGVLGLRGEVSMLNGTQDSESGPYFGFGFNKDYPGILLGYDYRKYIDFDFGRQKIGTQVEINISELGPLLYLRPSISSVTGNKNFFYGGVHGILAFGRLETYSPEIEIYYFDSEYQSYRIDENIEYSFNSLGAGVTMGLEFNYFKSNSIQLQTDISFIKNSFITNYDHGIPIDEIAFQVSYDYESDIRSGFSHIDDPALMISVSAGMNLFKPDFNTISSFKPMPLPNIQPIYDPNTGQLLSESPKYNPETGEIIQNKINIDPQTGLKRSDKSNILDYTDSDIRDEAKKIAQNNHNKNIHQTCGVGSCVASPMWGISLLASLVYMNSNIVSTFDAYDPIYTSLNDNQKIIFKSAYQKEERQLRRKDISTGQKGCVGMLVGWIIFITIIES